MDILVPHLNAEELMGDLPDGVRMFHLGWDWRISFDGPKRRSVRSAMVG
jgi:hypothetical protein